LPLRKLKIRSKTIPTVFRLVFLLTFILLALLLSMGILKYIGVRDFFYFDFGSVFFYVFLTLLIVSIFVYRPVCRFFCPYGALLGLAAIKGRLKLRRNENCIDCKKCGEICPTNEAGRMDWKQECYMCNRCKEVCPVDGLDYMRKQMSGQPENEYSGGLK
jgi:ferredoxin-type protein NapH